MTMSRFMPLVAILMLAACSLPTEDSKAESPQAGAVLAPDVPGFSFLREETFSCGGQTNTVKIYRHDRTGLEFVLIPGGEFLMGSPEGESGRYDWEGPQRRVTIRPFLLCRTEVTNQAYRKVWPEHDSGGLGFSLNGDMQPAVKVSWSEAVEWCRVMGLRLPTEAEWEYACRGGTTTAYFWGDGYKEGEGGRYANIGDRTAMQEWPAEVTARLPALPGYRFVEAQDSFSVGASVGSLKPNAYGLFDMIGNVWEWVEDTWHANYEGAPTDGSARLGGSSRRVCRGGGWGVGPRTSRSAHRGGDDPGNRDYDLGFRPASPLR